MAISDLTKDLGARDAPDRTPLLTSLGLVLLAARRTPLRRWTGCISIWPTMRALRPPAPKAAASASTARR